MPFRHTDKGWFWGSKGPFKTKAKALQVARAAYASGYKEESTMDKSVIGEFVGTLLHSATITHFMHLKTRSYAQHVALGSYYDEIVDLVDQYVESYQGKYGIVENYPNVYHSPTDPVKYLESLQKFVAEGRQDLPQDTELQNIVDEIADLINSTTYKLKFLG